MDVLPPVDPAALPDDVRLLKSLVVELVGTLRTRDERIAQLERNMDLLARKVFGRTSEKVDPRQTVLFEQPAEEPLPEPPPSDSPSPAAPPPAKGRGRRPKPDTLRRVEVLHDLSDAEKQALAGDGELCRSAKRSPSSTNGSRRACTCCGMCRRSTPGHRQDSKAGERRARRTSSRPPSSRSRFRAASPGRAC